MIGFTHTIRSKIDDSRCLVDAVDKGSCGVSLADAPQSHVVIDLDETGSPLGPAQAKCDFLFFADPNVVVPIEIKDGAPDVARATGQLQAGADAADVLAPRDRDVNFRPVLVSRSLRRRKQMDLRAARVRFRKRDERVSHVVRGQALADALDAG